jgi:hypothetical protein
MELLQIFPSVDASKHKPKETRTLAGVVTRPIRQMISAKPKVVPTKMNLLFKKKVETPPTYGWTRPPITTKEFEKNVGVAYRG